ncbi:LAME_0F04610g1_1 [Lachancea meyersii CBS 8951]|uniref:LAME_0F04610g1_1 n=1 Tax=Lachancea meyersii CBS 8951 TaxID=1266667 RepID=A0A1G4JS59_9SACH|nr:LAME_0F04610g1_1 [Lachancea meyersii CBS 8951]
MNSTASTTHVGSSPAGPPPPQPSTVTAAGVVDLTTELHRLPQLEACTTIAETRSLEFALYFDLSQCGIQLPLPNYTRFHLKFPSTLVRRPKFQFSQLAQTLDHNTQEKLASEVEKHSIFVFYDEGSTLQNCSLNTSNILSKIIPYLIQLKGQNCGIKLLFLQGDKTSLQEKSLSHQQLPFVRPTHLTNARSPHIHKSASKKGLNKHNINLKIAIPSRDARNDNSDYMFIQSFKKDSIHYSPDSLKKYFDFHMPDLIERDDDVLPTWLKKYSEDSEKNLLMILKSFECLEKLEVKRLERCLQSSKQDPNMHDSGQTFESHGANSSTIDPTRRPKPHKLYSFREMQKEYKPNRHDYDSDNDGYHQAEEMKLKMDIHEELHDGENQEILSKLMRIRGREKIKAQESDSNGSATCPKPKSIAGQDEDEDDVAETPMDNYLLTRGIQAYSKNRYSNILPYEHSRVKLEPSPIWPDNKCSSPMPFPSTLSSPPLSNKAMRKRRNSYFSQERSKPEKALDQSSDQTLDNARPPLRASASFDSKRITSKATCGPENDQFNDYFNANYLKIPQINPDFNYIATQAPLPSTLDDFWKVVLTNDVKVILSLNSDDELNMRKWDIYWNSSALEKYDVRVKDTYENVCGVKGCILRVFDVRRLDSNRKSTQKSHVNGKGTNIRNFKCDKENVPESKGDSDFEKSVHTVCQLQYTKWLDSCGIVLEDVLKLHRIKNLLLNSPMAFIENIRKGQMYDSIMRTKELPVETTNTLETMAEVSSPLLVHCSAGCGRTGVFITLDYLFNILEHPTDSSNRIDVWNTSQDLVFIIVNELRKHRISMVQNLTQYITCYEAILKYFELRKIKGKEARVH